MAPWIPRMHVFEIADQPWFPPWCRRQIQAALTRAWITRVPLLQRASPAELVAEVLQREVLGTTTAAAANGLADKERTKTPAAPWIMIDFCAGGGGPTPSIERLVNAGAGTSSSSSSSTAPTTPTQFVLTDLHPHVDEWAVAAAASPHVRYAPDPVDASAADPAAILRAAGLLLPSPPSASSSSPTTNGNSKLPSSAVASTAAVPPRVFRLFNLAFHHFDDPLARAILKNTVETSDGFGIFELQDRSLGAFVTTLVFGLGILLLAPYYAWQWGSPLTLVFTYAVPVLPFVLVFDGWMSMLRTRTPDEVAALLRTCGAAAPAPSTETTGSTGSTSATSATDAWELRSGETRHLWPCGYLKWIVCVKKDQAPS
ncbi:hypothetical protein SPI_09242 [Niveomyces insectorum RCEF 264]|uniref:Uncharacterized protein n=1 Tax=Niveomyces insectorum RCEF 264 TaxID=1081102 RepID=A0A167M1E7_9HYPO|nr:hypothetical protein SPI_09242 [Niveomyces insectorum RCEF 264]